MSVLQRQALLLKFNKYNRQTVMCYYEDHMAVHNCPQAESLVALSPSFILVRQMLFHKLLCISERTAGFSCCALDKFFNSPEPAPTVKIKHRCELKLTEVEWTALQCVTQYNGIHMHMHTIIHVLLASTLKCPQGLLFGLFWLSVFWCEIICLHLKHRKQIRPLSVWMSTC